jgi:ATP-dependent RNA helicase DeaD
MDLSSPESLPGSLAAALAKKGYTSLTSVQQAVLDPAHAGRDLRISSQTGSGKTVAIGLVIHDTVASEGAKPRAIVITPTRELARQVEEELGWLYAGLRARVVSVTGGAGYRDERRALAAGPAVVVGTPGRLLDHLQRGGIDASGVAAVVLDEADRLLDMGFRDDIEAIIAFAPAERRTHLVSATFPREVRALADKVQRDPAHVEGTRLGAANLDIDHVLHVVDSRERMNAMINILLANPEEQTLVFARTRADVAEIARQLEEAGFAVASISGELDQPARNRALAAFKRGDLRVLVATDVAARGIDVQDIARVVHAEPPSDADSYTHRSGRTGRAGRKGTSAVLVTSRELAKTRHLLQRANVSPRTEPVPSADDIRAAGDARVFEALTRDEPEAEREGFDERTWSLAKRVAQSSNVTRAIARLLIKTRYAGPTEPRVLRVPEAPKSRARAERTERTERTERGGREDRDARAWVSFRVSWGQQHGADPRRVLAVVCRRGHVRGTDVGSIRVARTFSVVDVASNVADAFSEAAARPDPRDPNITIRKERAHAPHEAPPPARKHAPPRRRPR